MQIFERIGEGGHADIYRGEDSLGRQVAIKFIHASVGGNDFVLAQAKALAKLNDENVVRVYDVKALLDPATGDVGDAIIMELVQGEQLCEYVQRSDVTRAQVRSFGFQLIRGVAAIHRQKISHGDLHSGNVLLDLSVGIVKIIDILYYRSLSSLSTTTREEREEQDLRDLERILLRLLGSRCIESLAAELFGREAGALSIASIEARFRHALPQPESLQPLVEALRRNLRWAKRRADAALRGHFRLGWTGFGLSLIGMWLWPYSPPLVQNESEPILASRLVPVESATHYVRPRTINRNIAGPAPSRITIRFPEVVSPDPSLTKPLNDYIQSLVDESMEPILKDEPGERSEFAKKLLYTLDIDYEVRLLTNDLFSATIYISSYMGGAHGATDTTAVNWDIPSKRLIKLNDIFRPSTDYLSVLRSRCNEELGKILVTPVPVREQESARENLSRGLRDGIQAFDTFAVTDSALLIIFGEYSVSYGANGAFQVVIPFSDVADLMVDNGPVHGLLRSGARIDDGESSD